MLFGKGNLVKGVSTGVGRVRPTVVRVASLLRGLIVRGVFVNASVIYVTRGLPVSIRLVLLRLVTVIDLRPGVLLIRDGAVKVVVEDNAVPDK